MAFLSAPYRAPFVVVDWITLNYSGKHKRRFGTLY